jgi:hypothetical protein
MRKFARLTCLIVLSLLSGCGGYNCTFYGADWGFAPNVTYVVTWQDPTSSNYVQNETTTDSYGNISLQGGGSANCNEFGFSRCYTPELAGCIMTESMFY